MKNMMNTVATSISKTNNGIGTGIHIPDEMVKGIDPNQLTTLLTHVLSSVYSAIYEDEKKQKKQMDEMLARGICPMCGASLDEDEDDCDCDCCDDCDCEDDEDELMLDEDEDEDEEADEDERPMRSIEDIINYLHSIH